MKKTHARDPNAILGNDLVSRLLGGETDFAGKRLWGEGYDFRMHKNFNALQEFLKTRDFTQRKYRVDLQRSNMKDLRAPGLYLPYLMARGSVFDHADLSKACLTNADFRMAGFRRAILTETDFTEAFLTGAILANANLTGAVLVNARLNEASLLRAVAVKADLRCAKLRNAKLDYADLSGADLSGADLTGASFANAILIGANLEGAILDKAMFTRTNLNKAVVTDRSLDRAIVQGVDLEVISFVEKRELAAADAGGDDSDAAEDSGRPAGSPEIGVPSSKEEAQSMALSAKEKELALRGDLESSVQARITAQARLRQAETGIKSAELERSKIEKDAANAVEQIALYTAKAKQAQVDLLAAETRLKEALATKEQSENDLIQAMAREDKARALAKMAMGERQAATEQVKQVVAEQARQIAVEQARASEAIRQAARNQGGQPGGKTEPQPSASASVVPPQPSEPGPALSRLPAVEAADNSAAKLSLEEIRSKLKELKELQDEGLIEDADFNQQKQRLLAMLLR